jgi:uncharacterized membrane protein YoaK (UPF0700 family)
VRKEASSPWVLIPYAAEKVCGSSRLTQFTALASHTPSEMNPLVPGRERNQQRLAICLALTAGYLDGYGLRVLGTYVSFMSGNTTMVGLSAGQGNLLAALSPGIAIASFLGGSLVGNLVTHSRLRHAHQVLFGLIATLLAVVWRLSDDNLLKNVNIAILSFGTGMVNPALSRIGGEAVSLTFVTGTLSRLGSHLALALRRAPVPASEGPWDTHLYRARIGAQLWASFISGAALSGMVSSITNGFVLLPGIAMMVVLALVRFAEPPDR